MNKKRFLIPHHQIDDGHLVVKWNRHSQMELLPADIIISLAICHRDEKNKQKVKKRNSRE